MKSPAVVDPFVSPRWLFENLDNPGIQIIENAGVPESYFRAHIPGAVRVPCHPHLKRFNTAGEKTQYVMSATEFSTLCHDLGLQSNRQCVVYDDHHGLFAARFRTVCRYHGFNNVSILDGGWNGWLDHGHPVSARVAATVPGSDVVTVPEAELFVGLTELQRLHQADDVQIWDTREPEEFNGTAETENQRRGHIPGALNLSWTELLTGDEDKGTPRFVKSPPELATDLAGLGLQRDKTIIAYCQSGIRAAFCLVVLEQLGYAHYRLYDGSMGEWANQPDTPLISPAT